MTQKTKAAILAQIPTDFPTNGAGLITATVMRGFQTDVVDSIAFLDQFNTLVATALSVIPFTPANLLIGGAAVHSELFRVEGTQLGYASSTQYCLGDIYQYVRPAANSDTGTTTYTDYVGLQVQNIVPEVETHTIGKQRSLVAYTYNYGSGAGHFGFGATFEYWNQRNAQITQATGALIICNNDMELFGYTGFIGNMSGISVYARNGRSTGSGSDYMQAGNFVASNHSGGTLPSVAGLNVSTQNLSVGTITFAIAADLSIVNTVGGTYGTAYGIRTGFENPVGGAFNNFYHIFGRLETAGHVINSNHYFIYGETTAPSFYTGFIGIGWNIPRFALHVHVPATSGTLQIFTSTASGNTSADGTQFALGTDNTFYFTNHEVTGSGFIFRTLGTNVRMTVLTGVMIGTAPTGGDKGSGTINVQSGIYLNDTAYTNPDYVFEHAYTGKIEKFKSNPGASEYNGRLTLNELREYTQQHLRFPGITDEPAELGWRMDKSLLLHEETALYLFDMDDRINGIEDRLDELERSIS